MPGATFVPFLPIGDYIDCDAVALASASKAWNLPGLKCAVARRRLRTYAQETRTDAARTAVERRQPRRGRFDRGLRRRARRGSTRCWTISTAIASCSTELVARELPGVRYIEPQASYLAWLDCTALDLGPDPVSVFLERSRVALTRGRDFGPASAGFVRVNMGTSAAILTEIVERMAKAL